MKKYLSVLCLSPMIMSYASDNLDLSQQEQKQDQKKRSREVFESDSKREENHAFSIDSVSQEENDQPASFKKQKKNYEWSDKSIDEIINDANSNIIEAQEELIKQARLLNFNSISIKRKQSVKLNQWNWDNLLTKSTTNNEYLEGIFNIYIHSSQPLADWLLRYLKSVTIEGDNLKGELVNPFASVLYAGYLLAYDYAHHQNMIYALLKKLIEDHQHPYAYLYFYSLRNTNNNMPIPDRIKNIMNADLNGNMFLKRQKLTFLTKMNQVEETIKLLESIIKEGGLWGYNNLGNILNNRNNKAQVLEYYQKGMDAGDINAKRNYAFYLLFGTGGAKDEETGLELLIECANDNDTTAMKDLASYFKSGEEYNTAIEWLEKLGKLGDKTAFNEIGLIYERFLNNKTQALEYYQKGMEAGHIDAKREYILCLLQRTGRAQDEEKGLKLLIECANNNHTTAVEDLVSYYSKKTDKKVEEFVWKIKSKDDDTISSSIEPTEEIPLLNKQLEVLRNDYDLLSVQIDLLTGYYNSNFSEYLKELEDDNKFTILQNASSHWSDQFTAFYDLFQKSHTLFIKNPILSKEVQNELFETVEKEKFIKQHFFDKNLYSIGEKEVDIGKKIEDILFKAEDDEDDVDAENNKIINSNEKKLISFSNVERIIYEDLRYLKTLDETCFSKINPNQEYSSKKQSVIDQFKKALDGLKTFKKNFKSLIINTQYERLYGRDE